MTCETLNTGPFSSICGGTQQYQYSETRCTERARNPNYHELKAQNKHIPMLPYYKSRRGYSQEIFISPKFGGYTSFMNCFGGGWPLSEEPIAKATDIAVSNAFRSLNKLQHAKWGVALAEARESGELLVSSARRLIRGFRNLKKGKINNFFNDLGITNNSSLPSFLKKKWNTQTARAYRRFYARRFKNQPTVDARGNLTKNAANLWLEVQFGWKPILDDIHSSMEGLLFMRYGATPPLYRIVGIGEQPITEVAYGYSSLNNSGNVSGSVRVKFVQYYRVTNSTNFNAANFGLSNPYTIVWELVPYSFLVDWILPVGKYLDAMDALSGLSLVDSCFSVKTSSESSVTVGEDYPVTYSTFEESFRRTVPYVLPSMPPLPSVDFSKLLDSWKITTTLALWKSTFSYK
jgi:hypothetical protein